MISEFGVGFIAGILLGALIAHEIHAWLHTAPHKRLAEESDDE